MNKRNAVLGWAVWQTAKRMAKRKAKAAAPAVEGEAKHRKRTAVLVGALATVGGALLFWRRRHPDIDEPVGPA